MIIPEKLIGLVSLGDKIQITGTLIIYNALDRSRNRGILARNIRVINNEKFYSISEQEIKTIENIAKQPLVQQKLADLIFSNIFLNQDIKYFWEKKLTF